MKSLALLLLTPFFLLAAPFEIALLPSLAQGDPVFGNYSDNDTQSSYDGSYDARLNAGIYFENHHAFIYQLDLLLPFFRNKDTLFYGDILFIDPSGKELQMSGGLGFRHIRKNWMWGGFVFFDRLKSPAGNFFNQLVFGGSLQSNEWWFSLMAFFPFHNTSFEAKSHNKCEDYYKNILFRDQFERILTGVEGEAGYGFFKDETLRLFLGYYYYTRSGMPTITGPRLRVTYRIDTLLGNSVRIIDYITLEGMVRHDSPRGTDWYIGARITIPLGGKSKRQQQDLQRYMNDYVRYDID